MFYLVSILLVSILSLAAGAIYHTARPRNFPRNVPAVTLWAQIRSKVLRTSRVSFYNTDVRPLAEKHGAVALWQEDCWAVIVSRPDYIVQVLKNAGQELEKRGTYARNPNSNGGFIFGENIIDSNGQLHAEFTDIVKPAITKRFFIASMQEQSVSLAGKLSDAQKAAGSGVGISIDEMLWKWSITVFGDYFFDTKDWPLSFHETSAQHITALQSPNWVANLRNMFSIFNLIPWRPASFKQAAAVIQQLDDTLFSVAESRKAAVPANGEPKLGQRLAQAHDAGLISSFHYRSNLKQLLVAGHENVEVVLQSAMYELAVHPSIQDLLYDEVTSLLPPEYSAEDLDRLPLLASVVYETLRLYPPLGMLINRRTVKPMWLGSEILVPAGIMVGWNSYLAHTDAQTWGERARIFDPSRWGDDIESIRRMARSAQARGQFVPFSLHARRCLGSTFALTQLKVALSELVRRTQWREAKQSQFKFNKVRYQFICAY